MTTKILGNQITSYTIDTVQLSNTATAAFVKTLAPKILYANVASNTYTILDDAAVNVGGGYIVITGAEFQSGATVLIDVTPATSVTYVNTTTIQAQVPAKSASSYNLYVVNPDGGTGIKPAGITYSGSPTWVTASPLTDQNSNTPFNITFSATGANTYSVANGSTLPAGTTLMANGYFYGNISIGSATTYNFNITATDAELQDSDKTFSLTVNTLAPTYTATYLVVAGGGGGGTNQGGGGGAGGMITGTVSLSIGTPYAITVGSGGTGGRNTRGVTGNNSSIGVLVTSLGGGGGGGSNPASTDNRPGLSGGSGGGGQGGISPAGTGGSGTPGQGNSGGAGSPFGGSGGGGGAGGAGSSASEGNPAPGGAGLASSITGTPTLYAGGGGNSYYNPGNTFFNNGGPGGGGGGFNDTRPAAVNGTANRGGGGGGTTNVNTDAGSGGSGVVILSIATSNYPGSAPGATVTTSGANTILTFNSSGTFTA
jgi:hypothetical protein